MLVPCIAWKSKGLTWSDLSKAGAVNNCSVLVPCIAWKSKGLSWSELDKAARKELLGACPLHRLEVERSELV